MPVTILQLAGEKLNRGMNTTFNMEDLAKCGLPFFGGCGGCGASLAAYNMYPSKNGYVRCEACIGDDGFDSIKEAREFMFPVVPEKGPCCDCGKETRRYDGERFQCRNCCYNVCENCGNEICQCYEDEPDPEDICNEHCMNPTHNHKE